MKRAFTLIELLIVVAIIAILAAIAVPNFIEAQVRARVSRVHSDMRTLATAFEAYAVDFNMPPLILPPPFGTWETRPYRSFDYWLWARNVCAAANLTTPVAYIATLPRDPFPTMMWGQEPLAYGVPTDYGFFYHNAVAAARFQREGLSMGVDAWTLDPTLSAPVPCKLNGVNDSVRAVNWMLTSAGPDKATMAYTYPNKTRETLFALFTVSKYQPLFINGDKIPYDPTNGTMSEGNIYRMND